MYMPGEPIIEEDWAAFMTQYELVKADPELILPWPPKYPSDDMEQHLSAGLRSHSKRVWP